MMWLTSTVGMVMATGMDLVMVTATRKRVKEERKAKG
jgi:hypothetical protein